MKLLHEVRAGCQMGLQALLNYASSSPAGAVAVALLLIVGAMEGIKSLLRLASGVYIYFLRPGRDLRRLGSWALVTGATDGIGKAYAAALAKKGAGRRRPLLCAKRGWRGSTDLRTRAVLGLGHSGAPSFTRVPWQVYSHQRPSA